MTPANVVPASLTARRRAMELDTLASGERVDVLVIGGGVTGAGAALDAASRGLSVALIEARDLAFGTSRWSSKLVHGGLRYLAHGHVRLARESAVERDILMRRTAPHLTRPMAQLFPRYANTPQSTYALTVAGVGAGDALRRLEGTPSSGLPRPRSFPASQALTMVPGLRETGLRGGLLAFDGTLTDDARPWWHSPGPRRDSALASSPRCGLDAADRVRADELAGQPVELRARQVINATGVWAEELVPKVAPLTGLTSGAGRPGHGDRENGAHGARSRRDQSIRVPPPRTG